MKLKTVNYHSIWWELVDRFENALREHPETRWTGYTHSAQPSRQAFQCYKLFCFAERIATDPKCPWGPLSHTEAMQFAVLNKHHWTLEQVRALTVEEDFLFLLRQELVDLLLKDDEEDPILEWLQEKSSLKAEFGSHLNSLS